MDTIYIGEIPLDYKFAVFSSDYITLYNQPSGHNENLPYYRIYKDEDYFYYSQGTQYFGNSETTFIEVPVSNEVVYRRDFDSIVVCLFVFSFLGLFLLNLITSIIRKGGVLGGLL